MDMQVLELDFRAVEDECLVLLVPFSFTSRGRQCGLWNDDKPVEGV